MTTIDTSLTTGGTASTLKQQQLGQMDFLKLLTAQLQTQDPFEPMDNSQMVAQMATITNASGVAEMNQTLSSIKDQLAGNRLGDAASWIGRSMLVKSNIAAPDASGQYIGQITLPEAAENVSIELVDGSGGVVHTIEMGARGKGDTSFYWDGKDADGNQIGTQPLQVRVKGVTPTSVATWTPIAAVQSPGDGTNAKLITPLGSYSPTDALRLA
ncbi:flagellar hook assembly protein FlgD [Sphingobium subterraneum]|uniref:Basal-body rod modification protein FlgD n=1 Tax=Sphingobium subterraneum TaxID=627688 RepID=A0A841IZQ2_9SPHN|nr:flagellar hook capping FlgD N-terminal domain-containing protein [Sphingobium subterraneum]MBB6123810.1 flagellar basal-body rod modification protein FlgD [Sphingobium subterraneum]